MKEKASTSYLSPKTIAKSYFFLLKIFEIFFIISDIKIVIPESEVFILLD